MIHAAIVGLGRWGQNLVNSVQGKSEQIRFVAGVLRHPEKAREYAQKQGLVLHDDLDAVLKDPAIDAVVLATPHTAHAEQIIRAARAGKHVFTEKPFTLTREEAAEALRIARAKKVTLAVGYNWRFQPALQEIRAMLNDGRLGKLLHIEGNFCGPSVYRFGKDHWRQSREEGPGGGMTGRGVHVVDAMLYLAGHVDRVYAQSDRLAQDFGIDDTTSMLLRFRNGTTAYLGTVIATAETWRMQVFGANGWVEVGDTEHLTTWQMRACFVDRDNLHTHHKPQIVTFPETSTERAELENFAMAVARGELLAMPGGDEEHGVAVFEAIMASAKSGAPVSLRGGARRAATKKKAPAKKKALAKKAPAKKKRPAGKTPAKKKGPAGKAPSKKKGPAGKAPAKKRIAPARQPASVKKATKKKAPAKKRPAKKAPAKKAPAKKRPAKKAPAKKAPAKK